MSEEFTRPLEMIKHPDGTSGQWIKLPVREKILKRLVENVGDNPDLQGRLYPLLLERGERIVGPAGIVTLVASALAEYKEMDPPPKVTALEERANDFIKALTPGAKDDKRIEEIRKAAEDIWRQTYSEKDTKSEQ